MNRIAAIPWALPPNASELAFARQQLTGWLRTSVGTQVLRDIQVRALLAILETGGLVCNALPGAGKTLVSGLAPVVTGSRRPLLLAPAKHTKLGRDQKSKILRELQEYSLHWRVPLNRIRIVSYSRLSRQRHAGLIEEYQPDLIVCDEAHALKRYRHAGCARRVSRYLAANPECKVVILTATLLRDGFTDYAHLIDWALRGRAPVPRTPDEREAWADCLDEPRRGIGPPPNYEALAALGPCTDRETARKVWRERLHHTAGIVISEDKFDLPLEIRPIQISTPPTLEQHWINLRELWMAPDEWIMADQQIGVTNLAQQLALGFFYRHVPRPPDDWAEARRDWCRFCRSVLEDLDLYDTEAQIRDACIAGKLPDAAWLKWIAIKDLYCPEIYPEWLSTHALEAARQWGKAGGLIWTSYRAFGEALSTYTGWPYYGQHGLSLTGESIDRSRAKTAIVSAKACSEGFNLQDQTTCTGWNRNLFVTPPIKSLDWEQRVGRTHREGQTADRVVVDYFVGCRENALALPSALSYARYTSDTFGRQKLLDADLTLPDQERGPAFEDTRKSCKI